MDERGKKLIHICANTKGAFRRLERFVENYSTDSKPEQLEVRLKLINENWEKYTDAQDELEELGHDSNSQQQCDEMEGRYCYLTGFIQTKMKELELEGVPQLNATTELVVEPKLPQLSVPKFSGNLQDCITFKGTFLSLVGDITTIPNIQKFHYFLSAINGDAKKLYSTYL
jgi:hypothetical protein